MTAPVSRVLSRPRFVCVMDELDGADHDRWTGAAQSILDHDEAQRSELAAMRAERAEAVALLSRAVAGLSGGACLTCGAEPGCNIDCPGCLWISDAEKLLARAREVTK